MSPWLRIGTVYVAVVIGCLPACAQDPYGYGPQPMPSPAQPGVLPSPQTPTAPNIWNLLNQARAFIQEGRPQQAIPLTEEFIRLKPLEPEGYFWQGVALDNMTQTQMALKAYQIGIMQVVRAGMDSAELRMNAGNDLLKLGQIDAAIEQYRRAAQIDPGLPLVQLNLGRALTEKGDIDGALECFQRCEDLHFKPYQLSYYRAKCFVKAGRIADAKAQILSALSKLNDASAVSTKLKEEFSSVLSSQ